MDEPNLWTRSRSGVGGRGRGHSEGDSNDWAIATAGPFQERVLIPRVWHSAEAKPDNDSDGEEDRHSVSNSSSGSKSKGGDRRGGYKCGRCGQPKKGHTCTNKPRLRTAFVETAETEVQSERDPTMVLRHLDTKLQGFPESYGLTFRWAPSTASLYAAQQHQQQEGHMVTSQLQHAQHQHHHYQQQHGQQPLHLHQGGGGGGGGRAHYYAQEQQQLQQPAGLGGGGVGGGDGYHHHQQQQHQAYYPQTGVGVEGGEGIGEGEQSGQQRRFY